MQPMDNISPSPVDGIVVVETESSKPVVERQSPGVSTESADSMAPKTVDVQTEVKSEEGGGTKAKLPKSQISTWDPEDFFRDAAWFKANCKLSDEGDIPHKISDVTDKMLKECFGEKSRSGYKLSLCTGIPVADLLALSQVADGYDKPVNGMVSHTFAKGAYVERILQWKVNWASYAATKLKGQVLQVHKDHKPKPDGPPWIRKPQMYLPPTLEEPRILISTTADKGKMSDVDGGHLSTTAEEKTQKVDPSAMKVQSTTGLELVEYSVPAVQVDEFLKLIGNQVKKTKTRLTKVADDRAKVEVTISKLNKQELGNIRSETALTVEIGRLDVDIIELERKLLLEEDLVGEATSDIELEMNKETEGDEPDEIGSQLLAMMTQKLDSHQTAVRNLESLISRAKSALSSTKDQLERMRKKHASLPRTVNQLTSLSTALEVERVKVESYLNDQITEERIVGHTLSKHCAPLLPVYVLTSTDAFVARVTVTSCPLCCNGYHCNNWVPASCGHTYHPMCLFTHLTIEKVNPKCIACGEVFSADWLRSWGLGTCCRDKEERTRYQGLQNENEDVYGKDCNHLARRRQWVQNMGSMQTKDDVDEMAAVSGLRARIPSAMTKEVDLVVIEDDLSMQPLLTPKLEGDCGKKCKPEVGSVDRTLSSTPPSVGQHSSIVQHSDFRLPLTPTATLPFSPETTIAFKPYKLVKTSHCTEPDKRKSRRIQAIRKKPLHFSD